MLPQIKEIIRKSKIENLKHSISLCDQYIADSYEREKRARHGFIFVKGGKDIPILSKVTQFSAIHAWKQRQKQLISDRKFYEKQLWELQMEYLVA